MISGAIGPDGQAQEAMRKQGTSRGSALFFLAACAVLLLGSGVAEARIVPQKGIMGINLQMTRARVIQEKGQPDSQQVTSNEILGQVRVMRYGKTRVTFDGVSNSSRAISVSTNDRRQRTRSGIGVGSRESAVRNRVQGVRCRTESGSRHCFKGRFLAGERVTDFSIATPARRVTRVTIGIVID